LKIGKIDISNFQDPSVWQSYTLIKGCQQSNFQPIPLPMRPRPPSDDQNLREWHCYIFRQMRTAIVFLCSLGAALAAVVRERERQRETDREREKEGELQ